MRQRLPNLITGTRLALLPVLVWLAVRGDSGPFGLLLLGSLASDVLDGALARALRVTSAFGAQLDSIADTLLFVVATAGVVVLFRDEVAAHAVAFWAVPGAWVAENVAALWRYGRLSSFHTYLSRAAAIAMGTFAAVLFARGFDALLLQIAAATVVVAAIEEFVLLWLLPTWTADVRGLLWVLRSDVPRPTRELTPCTPPTSHRFRRTTRRSARSISS
jgi:CDP-diacylglycerol--glycerol-3-phosphate 3-phosphatidyltransferase